MRGKVEENPRKKDDHDKRERWDISFKVERSSEERTRNNEMEWGILKVRNIRQLHGEIKTLVAICGGMQENFVKSATKQSIKQFDWKCKRSFKLHQWGFLQDFIILYLGIISCFRPCTLFVFYSRFSDKCIHQESNPRSIDYSPMDFMCFIQQRHSH